MKIGVENFKIFKDKVEFDLGEIMIITGPNGSGKSTLIDLITLMGHNFKDGPNGILDTSVLSDKYSEDRIENFERFGDAVTFGWYTNFSTYTEIKYLYNGFEDKYVLEDVQIWDYKKENPKILDSFHHFFQGDLILKMKKSDSISAKIISVRVSTLL